MSDTTSFVLKTETDGRAASTILSLVLLDVSTGQLHSFADQPGYAPIRDGVACALLIDNLIQHTSYHTSTIERLFDVRFDPAKIIDTYVAVRDLLQTSNNSLDMWAPRLGMARSKFRGAEAWRPAIQRHCEHDARIVAALHHHIVATVAGQ